MRIWLNKKKKRSHEIFYNLINIPQTSCVVFSYLCHFLYLFLFCYLNIDVFLYRWKFSTFIFLLFLFLPIFTEKKNLFLIVSRIYAHYHHFHRSFNFLVRRFLNIILISMSSSVMEESEAENRSVMIRIFLVGAKMRFHHAAMLNWYNLRYFLNHHWVSRWDYHGLSALIFC